MYYGTVSKVVSAAWVHEFKLLCGFKISLTPRSSSAAGRPTKRTVFQNAAQNAAQQTIRTRRCQEAFRQSLDTFSFQNKSQLPVKFLRNMGSKVFSSTQKMCIP